MSPYSNNCNLLLLYFSDTHSQIFWLSFAIGCFLSSANCETALMQEQCWGREEEEGLIRWCCFPTQQNFKVLLSDYNTYITNVTLNTCKCAVLSGVGCLIGWQVKSSKGTCKWLSLAKWHGGGGEGERRLIGNRGEDGVREIKKVLGLSATFHHSA